MCDKINVARMFCAGLVQPCVGSMKVSGQVFESSNLTCVDERRVKSLQKNQGL